MYVLQVTNGEELFSAARPVHTQSHNHSGVCSTTDNLLPLPPPPVEKDSTSLSQLAGISICKR